MKQEKQPTEEQIKIYRRMSGEQRLRIGLEWSALVRALGKEREKNERRSKITSRGTPKIRKG